MQKLRQNQKTIITVVIAVVIAVFISVGSCYVLAESLINSKDVYYKDNSNLLADNVQDAIDGTCTKFNNNLTNLKNELLNEMYPIGSVYISTTMSTVAQVKTALGGTWEVYGAGRTLVGVGNNGTTNYTIGKTGGSETTSYTPSGTIGSTTLTISQIPSHTHTFTGNRVTTSENGGHTHSQDLVLMAGAGATYELLNAYGTYPTAGHRYSNLMSSAGSHTHTVTATGTNSNTGGGGGHTHTFTGTAANISTIQPYVTVYMYRRTA